MTPGTASSISGLRAATILWGIVTLGWLVLAVTSQSTLWWTLFGGALLVLALSLLNLRRTMSH